MTLNYRDLIPPKGVLDHIEYAIKRVNLSVQAKMLTAEEDLRIVSKKAIGKMLYLRVKRPINPYTPAENLDENDPTQWVITRRCHRRFSLSEIFKDRLPNGLTVATLTPQGVLDGLLETGINFEDEVSIEINGKTAIVKTINMESYMCWGEAELKLQQRQVQVET